MQLAEHMQVHMVVTYCRFHLNLKNSKNVISKKRLGSDLDPKLSAIYIKKGPFKVCHIPPVNKVSEKSTQIV